MESSEVFHKEIFGRINEEKQNRIINAAAEEFAEKGFSSANINIIAENAGVSVGSLYKYFETKNHLYLEVVNRGLALIEGALQPILTSDRGLSEKITGIIDAIFEASSLHPLMNRLYCRFTAESDSSLARNLAYRLETVSAQAYSILLEQAKKQGLIHDACDTRMGAFFMDNLFLTLQFSLNSEYWKDRMEIYLGEEAAADHQKLKEQLSWFISRAIGLDDLNDGAAQGFAKRDCDNTATGAKQGRSGVDGGMKKDKR